MASRFDERRDAQTSLAEEVREAASALLQLVDGTDRLTPHLARAVRATCDGVSGRLSATRLTLPLVGDAGARRPPLVNSLLGARPLAPNKPRRRSTVPLVRTAP